MIQLQFLNKVLETHDASVILVNNLTKEFFSDYEKEFTFISNHIKKYGNVPDKATFIAEFPDFYVLEVNEGIDYLLDKLFEDRRSHFLAETFKNVKNLVMSGKVDEAMRLYMSSQSEAVKATHIQSVDIFKDKSRFDAYVARSHDFSKYYVKTGFKELDDLIGGWDREEELATIVARSSVGKSWCLLKCAISAAEQGLTVGIYSGEMTEKKMGYRIDTLISHISNRCMLSGNASIQNNYKDYLDHISEKMKGTIKILTPAMIGGQAGVNALRAFIERDNLDMLCIDQHSLLADDRKAKNPVERASNISTDLLLLQKLKKIPFISVSQQNRSSTEDGVSLANIAQADKIGQDSTTVIFFEQKDDNMLTMSVVKTRDSVAGKKFNYVVDFDKGTYQYVPTEKDGLDGKDCEDLKNKYEMSDGGDEF